MLVKMTCPSDKVREYVEYGEAQGLFFEREIVHNREEVELIFSTSDKELASEFVLSGADSFLEFEDGTTAPMYVRMPRDFSE